jgi:ribosomal-protein-alanine N-acetyltransferase
MPADQAAPPDVQIHEAHFEPMTPAWLPEVLRLEHSAYAHPWAHANFMDTLSCGHLAQLLVAGHTLLGYFIAMKGVDEVHLLNITVAPDFQRQGWARVMLDALALWSRGQHAAWVWLEVRASNLRAQNVYQAYGFQCVGRRKDYYPAGLNQREAAIVMSLKL